MKARKCDCGKIFLPIHPDQDLCLDCIKDIEHDANVEMFGADAEYLEIAGLADKIGNK
jgi:hypothetical protein